MSQHIRPDGEHPDPVWDEAYELFDKSIEGTLTEADAAQLNELVAGDQAFRQGYLRYISTHAALHRTAIPVSTAFNRDLLESVEASGTQDTPSIQDALFTQDTVPRTADPVSPGTGQHAAWQTWLLAVMAAGIAILVIDWFAQSTPNQPLAKQADIVATLVTSKGCSWGESSLPTSQGSKLTRGRINLLTGLATIQFASGVSMSLEAPADVELIDSMNCVLHDGRMYATVPNAAQGFRVDTNTAVLVDHGTSFGVAVDKAVGMTDVQVFEGVVDVQQRTTQKKQRMLTGERTIVENGRFDIIDFDSDDVFNSINDEAEKDDFQDAITITTRNGQGREKNVLPFEPRAGAFKNRLIVKTSNMHPKYNSKSYIGLDLAAIQGKSIRRVSFQLSIIPSTRGYASLVPDATFAVYGVTDQNLDDWQPESMNWENAPANGALSSIDPARSVLLGRFEIPQGQDSGYATIESPQLVQFLTDDTNGIATLIVVRETSETNVRGLAHMFASSATRNGVAPTLRVITE
ncbi:FecR family protein [Neorhodopirellula lusitana]|uniref:FecR family protein n=1 Tax=Neorhodopirellula lusitana TaxID=445327 RepID=A0ABY1Q8J1_9BACT|nr:FecR domain-containing protein [Neorhodopirellula lusitana]SMP61986.1 FecR family protein [Neorhodopirellula lusitana]